MPGLKLPDYTALGTAEKPQSTNSDATYDATQPAKAMEQMGSTITGAGNNLQDMVNIAQVNDAMANQFEPKVNAMAANFYSLQGKQALDAAPQFTQQMQYTMNGVADTLTGQARTAFMRQAQGRLETENYRASMHAGEQAKQYFVDSSKAVSTNLINDYSANLFTEPNSAEDARVNASVNNSQTLQKLGYATTDPLYIEQMSAFNKKLDEARDGAVQKHFLDQPPDLQVHVATSSPGWPGHQDTVQSSGYTPAQVSQAILAGGEHSNGNPDEPTSTKGAVGPGQIMPGTFQQFALPGEDINNAQDNTAVHNRIINTYMQKYNGDAARVAVAYISGPGNVSPAGSPTPWIKDLNDGNENVSDYVAGVQQQLPAPTQPQQGQQPGQQQSSGTQPTYLGQPISYKVADNLTEAAISNKEHQDKLAKLNDDSNFQSTQNDFFNKMHGNQLTWQDIQTANLPVQGPGGKEWWQQKLNSPADKTDPAVYNTLFQRALMPDGSPGKLTDPKELLGYVGKGITDSNMKQIQDVMTGGEPGKEQLKAFFKQGHDQLSQSNMMNIDGEGEARAYNWQTAMFQRLQDGQTKGLSTTQMIDPRSKDYIGGDIQSFTSSLQDQSNNLANKIRGVQPAAPLPVQAQRQGGESPEEYVKRLGL